LPKVIRVDNGAPFGGRGALGLTRLSVWWLRLGIEVEFTRPAKPQDNGAHEQMHRVLKAETASPPAATLALQAKRFEQFRRCYNDERPHQGIELQLPSALYRPRRRGYREPKALQYPASYEVKRVKSGGRIRWHGRERLIGRAFAGQEIGLKPLAQTGADGMGQGLEVTEVEGGATAAAEVYLGEQLIGVLRVTDEGGMRPAQWVSKAERHAEAKTKQ
jgi:hypothetical protein